MTERDHNFRFYCPHAERVELVADALSSPVRMDGGHDGWWETRVEIPAAECRYHYLVDGRYSMPDYSAGDPEYDEFGSLVSVLRQEREPPRRTQQTGARAPVRASPADRRRREG